MASTDTASYNLTHQANKNTQGIKGKKTKLKTVQNGKRLPGCFFLRRWNETFKRDQFKFSFQVELKMISKRIQQFFNIQAHGN